MNEIVQIHTKLATNSPNHKILTQIALSFLWFAFSYISKNLCFTLILKNPFLKNPFVDLCFADPKIADRNKRACGKESWNN